MYAPFVMYFCFDFVAAPALINGNSTAPGMHNSIDPLCLMHVQERARQTRLAPTDCRPVQLAPRTWFLLMVQDFALTPVRLALTLRMQLAFFVNGPGPLWYLSGT